MTLEDPFFVVKDEVCKALNKTRGLYQRWCDLQKNTVVPTKDDLDWTRTELRNSLRSIEWDLEDLEETIGIVERNSKKFRIDASEIASRKAFIGHTKSEVKLMKDELNIARETQDSTVNQIDIEPESPLKMPPVQVSSSHSNSTRYSRLVNETEDSPTNEFIERTLAQQQVMMTQQDEQLDQIATSMSTLKTMSRQIGQEVDEQAVMLDDFGHEMENTHNKINNTLGKIAKVLRLTSDRRQWMTIFALSGILIFVIVLFFII